MNRIVAYARGFWQRMIGFYAHFTSNIKGLIDLAQGYPTNVQLTELEGIQMENEYRLARVAAEAWKRGATVLEANPPLVPIPSHLPFCEDETCGYNLGLVIHSPERRSETTPVQVAIPESLSYQKFINDFYDFVYNTDAGDNTPGLKDVYKNALENPDYITPTHLVKLIYAESE